MRGYLRYALSLLTLTVLLTPPAANAQTGRLAYIRENAAFVGPADGYAPAVRLVGSENAFAVGLSPADGTALVFVTPAKPARIYDGSDAKGLAFKPPYKTALPLVAPLDRIDSPRVVWSANGEAAFASDGAETVHGRYTPADGRTVKYPVPVGTASADGSAVVYLRDYREIRIRFRATGQEKVLFTPGKPQALFDAARRAKNPKGIENFLGGMADEMSRDRRNWVVGTPALTPDGKTVFFATNGGGGAGAAGNCTFAFFSLEVATGKIAVLSKAGEEFGRVPTGTCAVSPDGQRLMYIASVHVNAVENPAWVTVMDLATQKTRTLTKSDPTGGGDSNALAGACWSPDGKYVAYSQLYFDGAAAMKRLGEGGDADADINPAKYTLYIKEAATGRRVRAIPGAIWPSWGK